MNNKNNERGFSGLSSLTSDLSQTENEIDLKMREKEKIAIPVQKPSPLSSAAKTTDSGSKSNSTQSTARNVSDGKHNDSSGNWIIWVGVFFIFIWIFSGKEESNTQSSDKPTPNARQLDRAKQSFPQSSTRYQQPLSSNAPTKHRAWSESNYYEIQQSKKSASSSHSAGTSTSISPPIRSPLVLEAQRLLTKLGYSPGPIDGQYGKKTENSVRQFQKSMGLVQDGQINQNLIANLRKYQGNRTIPKTKPINARNCLLLESREAIARCAEQYR